MNVTQAILELVKEWGDATIGEPVTPLEINEGLCGDFASLIWDKLQRPDDFKWGNCYKDGAGHTWIVLYDKHYDAECPEGVEDWLNLPFFKRNPPEPGSEIEID